MRTYFIQSKSTVGNSLTPRVQIIATNSNETRKGFQVVGTINANSKSQALSTFVPDYLMPTDKQSIPSN
jgi:hypothetical protein